MIPAAVIDSRATEAKAILADASARASLKDLARRFLEEHAPAMERIAAELRGRGLNPSPSLCAALAAVEAAGGAP